MKLNRELYIKGIEDYLENGKNLLKLTDGTYENNGITVVVSNGIITINGTASSTSFISIPYAFANLTLYSGKTYTLNCNNTTIASGGLSVRPIGDLGTFQADLGRTNSTSTTTISSNQTGTYLLIRSNSGVVANNVVVKPQLEEGPIATNYEPYNGGYASKDYLENGKNKANIPTHTVAGQGTDYRIVDIEENTTYTLSCVKTRLSGVTITNGSLIMFVKFDFYNGSTKISSASLPSAVSFTTGSRYLTYTFTTPANCDNILLNLGNNNGDNNKNTSVSNVMLNKGSTALPYEEYYGKYLNKADIINGILSNNQMWRFKSFSLSGATSYDLTFDSIEDLGQFSIVIINTITSSNSSTKIGFCRNFSSYSYSNIFQDHTGTDVITNVSRTAGNVLRITTSTTSSIVVGVTYMRIFRQGLNYR